MKVDTLKRVKQDGKTHRGHNIVRNCTTPTMKAMGPSPIVLSDGATGGGNWSFSKLHGTKGRYEANKVMVKVEGDICCLPVGASRQ